MAAELAPILHVLAGPNGAGKSTLYDADIRHRTKAEFVNADRLAFEALGHHALTQAEVELGQRLANERRAALMAARQSLITESTFSHVSKVELVRDAKVLGYRVVIYHVNVSDADLSVARVTSRTEAGGHPVPEDRIRGRYARNGALIRQAVLLADAAFVFDNSRFATRPRQILTLRRGRVISADPAMPEWAARLYAEDLARAVGN